ncbi:MAG: carbohydrate-binding protein [Acidobacteriota bacterium]|nr:carbohydrate-binding protein [Acidobacteriota bacterium]
MRKTITGIDSAQTPTSNPEWLCLDQIARVEATSEDPNFPIEDALAPTGRPGWRASQTGEQRIRLLFDEPISLRHIHLSFRETESERTQEFTVRCIPASGEPPIEVIRQQWNFSPTGSTVETEDYSVDLKSVAVFELIIRPDLSGGKAFATLSSLRLSESLLRR